MSDTSYDRQTWLQWRSFAFPDGILFRDLQDAIQAAWLAGDRALAKEFAQRYKLYNKLCLCCAQRWISSTVSNVHARLLDDWVYQLCDVCRWNELAIR